MPKESQPIKIVLGATGDECSVFVGGENIECYGFTIRARVGEFTSLSIDTLYRDEPITLEGRILLDEPKHGGQD